MNAKYGKENCGCQVESLVSIDERGQMVLPKELRDRAKIKPGDKLTIVTWEKDGEICCLSLIKTDNFKGVLANLLGPMIKNISEIKV